MPRTGMEPARINGAAITWPPKWIRARAIAPPTSELHNATMGNRFMGSHEAKAVFQFYASSSAMCRTEPSSGLSLKPLLA